MDSNELTQFWEKYADQLLPLYKNTAATWQALIYNFADDFNDMRLRRSILNLKLTSVGRPDQNLIVIDLFLEDQEQDFFMGAIVGKDGMIDIDSLATYNSNYEFEGYSCDGCKKDPIVGTGCYHCSECDYDLCKECVHLRNDHYHPMFENNAHLKITEFEKKDIKTRILVELDN